jgi:hypothetical protein
VKYFKSIFLYGLLNIFSGGYWYLVNNDGFWKNKYMDDFFLNEFNHDFLVNWSIRNIFNLFGEVIYGEVICGYKNIIMSS